MSWLYRLAPYGKKRLIFIIIGLLLNSIIFSVSFTFLYSFNDFNTNFFGSSDNLLLYNPEASSVFSGTVPSYLSKILDEIPGIVSTSPEILSAAVLLDGNIITLRGITMDFYIQEHLNIFEGSLEALSVSKCLIGERVSKRLGIELGEPFSIRATRNKILYELTPIAVYQTGTPLDDEIIVDLDTARVIQGLTVNQVSMIRIKINKDHISEDTLQSILSEPYELKIETKSSNDAHWVSDLIVRTQSGVTIWEGSIDIPGEKRLSLPIGSYNLQLEDQQMPIILDSDQTQIFTLNSEKNRVKIILIDQYEKPLPGTLVKIQSQDGAYSHLIYTNDNGESIIKLESGTYQFEATSGRYTKVKAIQVTTESEIVIKVGPIPLDVLVFDEEMKPISEASVKIFNGSTVEQFTDTVGQTSFSLVEGAYALTVSFGEKTKQREIYLIEDSTIIFNLGEIPIHDLVFSTFWSNGTIAPNANVKINGGDFNWEGVTDSQGIISILSIPDNIYTVEAEKAGYSNTKDIETGPQNIVVLIIPAPVVFNRQDITPELLRYLPQSIKVNLQDEVFTDSMRIIVNLVTSSIIILAILFTTSTILNSLDIIHNAVRETSHTIGVFRSLGVSKNNLTLTFSSGIVLLSLIIGRIGYIIGWSTVSILGKKGYLLLAGYTLYPVDSLGLMLSASLICPVIAALALYRSINELLSQSILDLLKGLRKQDILYFPGETKYLIAAFIIPFLFRSIPEIIVWPLPTGYNTISEYIPTLVAMRGGFEAQVFDLVKQRPIFWVFALLTYPFEGIMPFKFFPVMLHGILGTSVYLYANQITLDKTKSLAISLITTLYFVFLRISWDQYDIEMGLILLFLTLTLLTKGLTNISDTVLGFALMLGSVLTHEATSMLLFAAAAPMGYKKLREKDYKEFTKWLIVVIIPLAFFIYRLIALDIPITTASLNNPIYPSSTYTQLVRSTLTLYIYVVLPLLPFSIIGLREKSRPIPLLIIYLLASLAALSPIISPSMSITFWDKWAYMTVIPLAYFTVQGICSLKKYQIAINIGNPWKTDLRKILALLYTVLILFSSLGFLATEQFFQPYTQIYGPAAKWVVRFIPSTMLMSTVPPSTANEGIDTIIWLNINLTAPAVLLIDEEFRGYAAFYGDKDKILVQDLGLPWYIQTNYVENVEAKAEEYALKGFDVYILARNLGFNKLQKIAIGNWVTLFQFPRN